MNKRRPHVWTILSTPGAQMLVVSTQIPKSHVIHRLLAGLLPIQLTSSSTGPRPVGLLTVASGQLTVILSGTSLFRTLAELAKKRGLRAGMTLDESPDERGSSTPPRPPRRD